MTKIVVLDDIHSAFVDVPAFARYNGRADVDIQVNTRALSLQERAAALKGVDAVIGLRERTRFDEAFFNDTPDLRLLIQTGRIGPHIDLAAATRHGVLVASAAGGGSASTVELTLGLMIAAMRRIPQGDRDIRAGVWDTPYGRTINEKTVGLLGFGKIGSNVSRVCSLLGANVLAWSRNMTPERAEAAGAKAATLDEVLGESDIVSVHLALNEGTAGLLTRQRLQSMKQGAYFVNTSRGVIVDEEALTDLLADGHLRGAALDVFAEEPLTSTSRLTKLDNVVLTPHMGWPADTGYNAFAATAVPIIDAFLAGTLTDVPNPDALGVKR